jgi:hypothetical protein
MKRTAAILSICALLIAVFLTITSFADETNNISWENLKTKVVPEDGPLKELAATVLNTGTKMTLDTQGNLRLPNNSYTSTFPSWAAMRLGIVSSNNEPFVVYGFDSLFPNTNPYAVVMIRVSQQRGKTDIIFATLYRDITEITTCDLYLTSPNGILEKHISDIADYSLEFARPAFQGQTNFWSEKLRGVKAKSDELKK